MSEIDPRDCQHGESDTQADQIASLRNQLAEAKKDAELYRTLLDAVENKWPDKTRHETALMYIKRAEAGTLTGVANTMREGE